jgi:hypothetical protein
METGWNRLPTTIKHYFCLDISREAKNWLKVSSEC